MIRLIALSIALTTYHLFGLTGLVSIVALLVLNQVRFRKINGYWQ